MSSIRERYSRFVAVLVAYDFGAEGGAWRSVHAYKRFLEQQGTPVHAIDMRSTGSLKQLLAASLFAPTLVLNGLYTLMHWKCLFLALLRKDTCLYLHETEWKLDEFRSQSPWKYAIFSRIMRRNPVLCVSESAANLYRDRFGSANTHVVYELPHASATPQFEEGRVHIVMVGTVEPRKGVELFSKVADLAHEKQLPWEFHWLGGVGSQSKMYQSPNVRWHGWAGNTQSYLARASLFFLSSEDDPCPLAALEGLLQGLPCVAYVKTGTAEVVESLAVGAVYSERDASVVLELIEQVASAGKLSQSQLTRVESFLDAEQFHHRIQLALKATKDRPSN